MIASELTAEVFKHFPAVGVCVGVAWYVLRLVVRVYEVRIAELIREHGKHLASKDAEIDRLQAEAVKLRKERDRWQRQATRRDE